jgi:glycosyltransferase involved in cell wall biosynthesis
MNLSVIITCFNDGAELMATLNSLFATSLPALCEVIVVDDGSLEPIKCDGRHFRVIRTEHRIGVGPARHLGALHAKSGYLLFVDSHSRFTHGWLQVANDAISKRPAAVLCGSCLGLGFNGSKVMNMDVTKPNAEYFGATWNFLGPDRKKLTEIQVFETIWALPKLGDDYELSGIMGACYIVPRHWYLLLNCGSHLTSYGCDEQELALKTWLAGGECRMLKGLRIGHKFKEPKTNQLMRANLYNATEFVVRNKLFLIHTILPESHQTALLKQLRTVREFTRARKMIEADWPHVELERARNRQLFKRDFSWFLDRFQLPFPQR